MSLASTSAAMRRKRHRRGLLSEYLAMALLICKGYRLIAWRTKTPVGEIDLIMRRGQTLAFIEVKGRRSHAEAAHAVHTKNQSRVVRAAQYFLAGHPHYAQSEIRFDVCLIAWYRWPQHLPHAFY